MSDSGKSNGGADAASAKGISGARAEWREYQYSVLRYTPMAAMRNEEVNIGVIVADRSACRVHRRLISEDDIERRNAEGLLPCPVLDALDVAACGDCHRGGGGNGSGDPVAALRRLHTMYGSGHPALRVTEPRYLDLSTHDHEGAAEWMYQTTLARGRELSVEQRRISMSGAEHPDRGEYWFASIQYVPDAVRDEAVNVGLAVADKASGMTIVRYVEGADREELGRGRFVGLGHLHPYECTSSVDDVDGYMRGIAEPDMSCVHCTPPRTASGRGAEGLADRLYARLVAHAPHHDGGRMRPLQEERRSRRL